MHLQKWLIDGFSICIDENNLHNLRMKKLVSWKKCFKFLETLLKIVLVVEKTSIVIEVVLSTVYIHYVHKYSNICKCSTFLYFLRITIVSICSAIYGHSILCDMHACIIVNNISTYILGFDKVRVYAYLFYDNKDIYMLS